MTRYLSAEKLINDDFDELFTHQEGEVVYDAKTIYGGGHWATMTQKSFGKHAVGKLGFGWGQKYVRNAAGELHKVEG